MYIFICNYIPYFQNSVRNYNLCIKKFVYTFICILLLILSNETKVGKTNYIQSTIAKSVITVHEGLIFFNLVIFSFQFSHLIMSSYLCSGDFGNQSHDREDFICRISDHQQACFRSVSHLNLNNIRYDSRQPMKNRNELFSI